MPGQARGALGFVPQARGLFAGVLIGLTGMRIQFFRHTQLGAARAGVEHELPFGRTNGLRGHKQGFRRMMAHAHGDVLGADAALRPCLHAVFHHPILQGMEGNDRDAPARLQPAEDGVEEPFQFADLVVDRHAQRLKRARGGVVPALARHAAG